MPSCPNCGTKFKTIEEMITHVDTDRLTCLRKQMKDSFKYYSKFQLFLTNEVPEDIKQLPIGKMPDKYLFSWDNIPGNDNVRLIEFLTQRFGIDWVKTAKIGKIDDGRTIRLTDENNFLSIKLNNEKTKAKVEINGATYELELIAKIENSKLNIYPEKISEYHRDLNRDLEIPCPVCSQIHRYRATFDVERGAKGMDGPFTNEEVIFVFKRIFKCPINNQLFECAFQIESIYFHAVYFIDLTISIR